MISLTVLQKEYQILAIASRPPQKPMQPAELATLTLPANLDLEREVILFGQAPMWVYAALVWRCQSAPWLACFAAQEGQAVVVGSRVPERQPGDVVAIALDRPPCPAIFIGGPPDSGKSVLANALRLSLMAQYPQYQVYLHRANWDGEGNWSHETGDRDLRKRLIREHERRLHERPNATELLQSYFCDRAQVTANLRRLVDLVLVDVGGKIQPEKLPLLRECTHYIIISRAPDLVPPWHDFCQETLRPVAVVHSVLELRSEITQQKPWLELVAGPWQQQETKNVPEVLLQRVVRACGLKEAGILPPDDRTGRDREEASNQTHPCTTSTYPG